MSNRNKTRPIITTPTPILPRSNQFTVPAGAGGGPEGTPGAVGGALVVFVSAAGVVVPDGAVVGTPVV